MDHEKTIDGLIKWIERRVFHANGFNPPTKTDLHVWLKHAKKFKREQDNLKVEKHKLEGIVEAVRSEPTFSEMLQMGRTLKWWMRHWNDIGHFKTGMELAISQWRERKVNNALAALEAHDAE